jgi:hypothetical protein
MPSVRRSERLEKVGAAATLADPISNSIAEAFHLGDAVCLVERVAGRRAFVARVGSDGEQAVKEGAITP